MNIVNPANPLKKVSAAESQGEIYSTEETRIGTWIDGKPLYRRTFVSDEIKISTSGTSTVIGHIENRGTIVSGECCIQTLTWEQNSAILASNYLGSDDPSNRYYIVTVRDNGDIQANCKWTDKFNTVRIIVTVKYTKTTD